MSNLSGVAKEAFQALLTYNYTLKLFDEDSNETTEPEDARRMWSPKKNIMVTILDDDDNSQVTLHIGKSVDLNSIFGLDQQLRSIATKYNMTYRLARYGKDISPKDFKEMSAMTEARDMRRMTLDEGMFYGTSMSSYWRLPESRMIVRHRKRIDDSKPGARSRCIESILIENGNGERFLFPTRDLPPARAMTQHLNQGGAFADDVGQQVVEMAHDYAALGTASRCLVSPMMDGTLSESAGKVREACRSKRGKLRKTFERMARPASYAVEAEDVRTQAKMLAEKGDMKLDETRISEMRRLLNDHDLPDRVFECMCRAVDESNQDVITEQSPLAENNAVVREFMQWTERFDPARLREFYPDFDMTDVNGNAEDQALMDFSAEVFLHSPEAEELTGDRETSDPGKNRVTQNAVIDALRQYFSRCLMEIEPGYDGDPDDLAQEVYPEVEHAMQDEGYIVDTGGLTDDSLHESEELTREDILLPSKNQGLDLTGEVEPAEVTDPDNPNQKHPPNAEYINRLAMLAGLRAAPAAQTPMN